MKSVAEKMYSRMPEENRKFISQINFRNMEFKKILEEIIADYDSKVC